MYFSALHRMLLYGNECLIGPKPIEIKKITLTLRSKGP